MHPKLKVLKLLAELFQEKNITWKLVGSTNLSIQGISIESNDIDIATTPENIKHINNLLGNYMVQPIKYKSFKVFEGYFVIYKMNNILVDVFSNILAVGRNNPPINIQLENTTIPCATLQEEFEIYEKLGKIDKVNLIKQALQVTSVESQ